MSGNGTSSGRGNRRGSAKRSPPSHLRPFLFQKGETPPGRDKPRRTRSRDAATRVWAALEKVEDDRKRQKKRGLTPDLFEHLVKRAFQDDRVLIALMSKLLPTDLKVMDERTRHVVIQFLDEGSHMPSNGEDD